MAEAGRSMLCLAMVLSLLLGTPGWTLAANMVSSRVQTPVSGQGGFNLGTLGLERGSASSLNSLSGFSASPSLPSVTPGSLDLPVVESQVQAFASLAPAIALEVSAGLPGKAAAPEALHARPASLDAVQAVLSEEAKLGTQQETEPSGSRTRWDRFWSASPSAGPEVLAEAEPSSELSPSGLAPSGASQAAAKQDAPPAPATPQPAKKTSFLKAAALPAGLAAVYGAARWSLPVWTPAFWVKAAPYVAAGGIFAATFAVNRLVRAGVTVLARKAGWTPGTQLAVRLAAGVVVWAAGGALALHSAGVSTAALLATFGIGGVAMTMAAKEFIGNFLEGLKILVTRPYVIGDRIRIGTVAYTVKDMNLRYMELSRTDGGTTMLTYTQLSEKPVTVFGEYSSRRTSASRQGSGRHLWSDLYRLAREQPKLSVLASSAWTLAGIGLAVGLAFMPGMAFLASVSSFVPYFQGALTLVAGRALEKGVVGFIRRLAESRGWSPQGTVVIKLGVQVLVYLVSGSMALRFFGLTWSALMTTLGASSIALGWASADVIGNLIQGFWILMNHPFTIGDRVEIGAVSGTVIDMNLNYVVLDHGDRSYTLAPYAVIKSSPFTVLSKTSEPAKQ
ncbi:MAG: mechanosensitive ion channel [Elusimicrobia bacterium]|nr:mechanosensitive ion channel [Elusimicrobiota bacterium]